MPACELDYQKVIENIGLDGMLDGLPGVNT